MTPLARLGVLAAVGVIASACAVQTPTPSPSTVPSALATATLAPSASLQPSSSASPRLTLPSPAAADSISISYTLTVDVAAGASGKLVLVVVNQTQDLVPELVIRWPTAVRDTVFLAPFQPSTQRIREGGDPLVQDWTKWVDGPGEHGEPAGTTSLGWGPLLPGATLTIPILATRVAPGPVSFDLQILNGEAILQGASGDAWFGVTVP